MWIINEEVRDLVALIDKSTGGKALDDLLLRLVRLLQARCAHPEVVARYAGYAEAPAQMSRMPRDAEGYIVAQSDFHEPVGPSFWERH